MSEVDWVSRVTCLLAPYLGGAASDHAKIFFQDHGTESPEEFAADEIDALSAFVDVDLRR